jgi:hypothetical protein
MTELSFLGENAAATTKMMNDMTIRPTGGIDRDFVAMMVPHHQGAIDMAKAELSYGHRRQLRFADESNEHRCPRCCDLDSHFGIEAGWLVITGRNNDPIRSDWTSK